MVFRKTHLFIVLFILCVSPSSAQNQPIGNWNSLLCYNTAVGVATDGNILYVASAQSFFTVNTLKGEVTGYSKVEGMHDIGMQCIGYDAATSTAVLVYANGNIDLFKDNTFYNIPDFKLKTIAGDKTVYQVYTENGKAYLSSTQGIIVLDLANQTVNETYQFFSGRQLLPVTNFTAAGKYYYALTNEALYRADKNNPSLQNFQVWQKIDSTHNFLAMGAFNDHVYLSAGGFDTVIYIRTGVKHVTSKTRRFRLYEAIDDTIVPVYTNTDSIVSLSSGNGRLFVSSFHPYSGSVRSLDENHQVIDSFGCFGANYNVVQLLDSSIWFANEFSSLGKRVRKDKVDFISPAGPGDVTSFNMYARNGSLYVAHGGFTEKLGALQNRNGISSLINNKWTTYKQDLYYPYGPFSDSMVDFVTITRDEKNSKIYAGSFGGGLFELADDGAYKIYKQEVFDTSVVNGRNAYQIVGSALDNNGNLWVSMFGSYDELYVKESQTGTWYKYHIGLGGRSYQYNAGQMVVDNANNIWYVCSFGGGIMGYSTSGTLADATDDIYYHLVSGAGLGNLPNSNTLCVAHDKNDNIWVGTSDGIGIIYNASGCISQRCGAEIPIVQYDKYAGYLFAGESVRTIAVDGANRKWIGTDNGVWLLSPDAGNSKIISRFTAENSPLPSDRIQNIAIDDVTGDVYIGTEKGLVCYRGTATEGDKTSSNVVTFPNPVPPGYKGTIAIKGLPENADVRITDINGQMVFRTTALGGQAIWSGVDYKGHRPQSGVYLVFATNSDGTQTYSGKMVFIN